MSFQVGRKKKLVLAASAVVLLIGLIAVPSMAAAQKTIRLDIIGPIANQGTNPVLSVAPSNTAGNVFAVKVTNTTPGSSNPNSFTVTVPSTPTTSNPNGGTGFEITNVAYVPTSCSPDCGAFGVGSTNPNISSKFNWTGATLSATGIDPMKQNQFVILKVTVATPSAICPSEGPYAWSATGWTGTNGTDSGQPFSVTAGDGRSTLLTSPCPAAATVQIDVDNNSATTPPTTATYPAPPPAPTVTFYASTTGVPPVSTITWQHASDFSFTQLLSPPCSPGSATQCVFNPSLTDDGTYYRAKVNNGIGTGGSPDPADRYSNVIQIAYAAPCGTRVNESGGGTTAGVVLVKNPVNTDPNTSCDPKAISLVVGQKSIQVLPTGSTCTLTPLNTCATYVVYSDAWAPEPAQTVVPATRVSPTGNPPSTTGTEDEVWCNGTYDKDDVPSPSNPDGTYGTMTMPDGHTWCRIQQFTTPAGTGFMQVSEISLLIGDATRIRGT